MHKKQLERHIEQDNYFGTLATVINMARQTLEKDMRGPKKNWKARGLIQTNLTRMSKKNSPIFFNESSYIFYDKIEITTE